MSNAESDTPAAQSLDAEIDNLYVEIEELHQQTEMLMGLVAGGYAYFLHQFILGHRQQTGITAAGCEQIVTDALQRIQSTQVKFEVDFLAEIQAVLDKMSQPTELTPYLNQALKQPDS